MHDGRGVFAGLERSIPVARYHSLIVEEETVGPDLEISARTADGIVMGLRHKRWPVEGVQFHPESFLTRDGARMLRNFLEGNRSRWAA
jgi:anthranilate/para-aminobenzoate synthase component II